MVRVRDLGITIGSHSPGVHNAITDVDGVRVGYATLIEATDIRTGVTMIVPTDRSAGLFAGVHRLHGNGEMTGCPCFPASARGWHRSHCQCSTGGRDTPGS